MLYYIYRGFLSFVCFVYRHRLEHLVNVEAKGIDNSGKVLNYAGSSNESDNFFPLLFI